MTIGWALVSPGAHAETLLAPAIGAAEGARFVAVCSRDQERAEAFANRHGAEWATRDIDDRGRHRGGFYRQDGRDNPA